MLTTRKKSNIIEAHKQHKEDTGSPEIQVSLLTEQVKELTSHLRKHPKDNHSRRGLLAMVSKRKKLLDYLKTENERRYNKIIKALDLKK